MNAARRPATSCGVNERHGRARGPGLGSHEQESGRGEGMREPTAPDRPRRSQHLPDVVLQGLEGLSRHPRLSVPGRPRTRPAPAEFPRRRPRRRRRSPDSVANFCFVPARTWLAHPLGGRHVAFVVGRRQHRLDVGG
jgi:hypothetical protein